MLLQAVIICCDVSTGNGLFSRPRTAGFVDTKLKVLFWLQARHLSCTGMTY